MGRHAIGRTVNRRGVTGINPLERPRRSSIAASLDPAIVEQAIRGDLGAFDTIVRDRIGAVYRLTLAIVGNEADAADATQDAFVAAWREIRRLRDADRLEAWLARIAVNSARMVARAKRRRFVREIPGLSALEGTLPAPDGEGRAPGADDARILGAALESIPAEQRTILALHHLEGRGVAEIGAILRIPTGTAKSRLFTARRALAAALAAQDGPR